MFLNVINLYRTLNVTENADEKENGLTNNNKNHILPIFGDYREFYYPYMETRNSIKIKRSNSFFIKSSSNTKRLSIDDTRINTC